MLSARFWPRVADLGRMKESFPGRCVLRTAQEETTRGTSETHLCNGPFPPPVCSGLLIPPAICATRMHPEQMHVQGVSLTNSWAHSSPSGGSFLPPCLRRSAASAGVPWPHSLVRTSKSYSPSGASSSPPLPGSLPLMLSSLSQHWQHTSIALNFKPF